MEVQEAIRNRRSIRKFTREAIGDDMLNELIDAARWAPSGLNNQPWRFMKITDRSLMDEISQLTKYRGIIHGAMALIAVFLDSEDMYDRVKDMQSAGAAIENMLLRALDMGLGTCWLGEILNRREEAEALLEVPDRLELVALVAVGYPAEEENVGVRRPLPEFLIEAPKKFQGNVTIDSP